MSQAPKSYKQFCGVAKALDIVGERWTLLIVRDLLLGPLRYSDFQNHLAGITPNLLAKRLRDLTEAGLITKGAPPERLYELTDLGRKLEPVVLGLGAFGALFMTAPEKDDHLDPRAAAFSLKRRYRGKAGEGRALLVLGPEAFHVHFAGTAFSVRALDDKERSAPPHADCRIEGAFDAWFPLLSGRKSLSALDGEGSLKRHGSAKVAARLMQHLGLKP